MDHAACHVVYVDKRARENRYMKRPGPSSTSPEASNSYSASPSLHEIFGELEEVRLNIGAILSIFNGGMSPRALQHRVLPDLSESQI